MNTTTPHCPNCGGPTMAPHDPSLALEPGELARGFGGPCGEACREAQAAERAVQEAHEAECTARYLEWSAEQQRRHADRAAEMLGEEWRRDRVEPREASLREALTGGVVPR